MDESEWFVLLASEEAAWSEWVDKEITHWLATKSVDRILPVVTDGAWAWDDTTGDFTVGSTAVPTALRGALAAEPRHLDLRWARDETDLDLRNSRFRSAVADLAAPMHGIVKDELEGEDIHQHRRARRLARGAVTVVVLMLIVSLIFGVYAVDQRSKANDNAARAVANVSTARQQLLISQSQSTLPTDRQLAALLAVQADRQAPSADTRDAMLNVVMAEPRIQQTFGGSTYVLAPLLDHRVVYIAKDGKLELYDWRTGRRLPWPAASPLPTKVTWAVASPDTTVLGVLGADGRVWTYSGRTLAPIGEPLATGIDAARLKLGFDGRTLAVWGAEHPETPGRVEFASYSRQGDTWASGPAFGGLTSRPTRSTSARTAAWSRRTPLNRPPRGLTRAI